MMEQESNHAPTKRSAMKTLKAAFHILNENNNEMRRKDLIDAINNRVKFEEWELERYPSNNQLKWLTVFLFYTVDCIKAGWLIKNNGVWYLTPDGIDAMKLDTEDFFRQAGIAYRKWKSENVPNEDDNVIDTANVNINNVLIQKVTIEELEVQAREGIAFYLDSLDGYQFQNLCSTLLLAMDYHIDYVSPPGKDGGIDIIAYKDALGYTKPRLKVQVKRYKENSKIDVDMIRSLKGLLHSGEDIGLFITTGYFTKDAERFARESNIHIKLIDRDKFIDLWMEHYNDLNDDERALFPLYPIYFLGSKK